MRRDVQDQSYLCKEPSDSDCLPVRVHVPSGKQRLLREVDQTYDLPSSLSVHDLNALEKS
jgi:hypothetical protein